MLKRFRPRRLTNILVLASSLQLVFLAVVVGSLIYLSARRSTLQLATQLSHSISQQVFAKLDELSRAPVVLNQLNTSAMRSGRLSPGDIKAMEQLFWQQMRYFPVGYINYGDESGLYVGVERLDDGRILFNEMGPHLPRRTQTVFSVDGAGRSLREISRYTDIGEAKSEAWYVETARAKRPIWSSIYQWDDKPNVLSISHNIPLYAPSGRLQGVIGVDLILSQLSDYLRRLWAGQPGLVLVLEPNGQLVASSLREGAVLPLASGGFSRIQGDRYANPLVRQVVQAILQAPPKTLAPTTQQLAQAPLAELTVQGQIQYLQTFRWADADGLNWIVAVVIPQSRFINVLTENSALALLLCVLAIAASLALLVIVTRSILRPLLVLQQTTDQLALDLRQHPSESVSFAPQLPSASAAEFQSLSTSIGALVSRLNTLLAQTRTATAQLLREVESRSEELKTLLRPTSEVAETRFNLRQLVLDVQQLWSSRVASGQPPLRLVMGDGMPEELVGQQSTLQALLLQQLDAQLSLVRNAEALVLRLALREERQLAFWLDWGEGQSVLLLQMPYAPAL